MAAWRSQVVLKFCLHFFDAGVSVSRAVVAAIYLSLGSPETDLSGCFLKQRWHHLLHAEVVSLLLVAHIAALADHVSCLAGDTGNCSVTTFSCHNGSTLGRVRPSRTSSSCLGKAVSSYSSLS